MPIKDMLKIRSMSEHDLANVMSIEKRAYPWPWSTGIFRGCINFGYHCHVYETETSIWAYSIMSAAAGEAHLLNLCVDPERQHKGVGRWVLKNVIRNAREQNAETLFLEVRVSNQAARYLYESEGFNEIGRRHDYYPADSGREDALVFARALL